MIRALIHNMTCTPDFLKYFAGAITQSGKINPKWKSMQGSAYLQVGHAMMEHFNVSNITEAWYLVSNAKTACIICNSQTKFSNKLQTYTPYCSPKCGQLDPVVKARREATNLARHGMKNAGGFGTLVHHTAMIEKYGYATPMGSELIKGKLKSTNLKKYGVQNVFAVKQTKDKIAETLKTRYGKHVTNSMQLDHVKSQYRNSLGEWIPAVTNVELRRKNKLTTDTARVKARLLMYGITLLSTPESFKIDVLHTVKHTCGAEFQASLWYGNNPRCYICNPILCGTSRLQQKVEEYIKSLGIEIQTKQRLLDGKEIDIFIPHLNLGIEINGLYWHSEGAGVEKNYHLMKTQLAIERGITLLHLYEDDINFKFDIIESILKTKLQLNQKIGARKCKLKEVSVKEAREFLNQNHLQGSAKFKVAVGLYESNTLVQLCTFGKPRFTKDYDYELIRFCTLKNYTVQGGFSKILKYFDGTYKPKNILTYADRSISGGGVYLKTGFTLLKSSPPGYWYFSNKEPWKHNRVMFQKSTLKDKLETFDPSKTEWENMQENKWNRIWDSGNLVLVKSGSVE